LYVSQAFYSRLLEGAIGIGKKKDKKQASKKPLCVRSKYLLQILHAAISSTISGRCIPKCSLWFIENCGNGLQKKNSHLKYNCVLKREVESMNLFFGTHLHTSL